jgi:NTE family protein
MVKVSKTKVNFLSFEGGGGKGLTYLGALQALEELSIVSYTTKEKGNQTYNRLDTSKIKGISGTSVGSLTALLLSCGYNSKEVEEILVSGIGNEILDTVEFGKLPTIYTKEYQKHIVQDPRFENAELYMKNAWAAYLKSDEKSFKGLLELPIKAFQRMSFQFFALLLRGYLNFEMRKSGKKSHDDVFHLIPIHEIIQSETQVTAANSILKEPLHSMNSLKYEYGFFLGEKARNLFDGFIERKSGIKNCTFKQFADEFNVDLVITSVCINTGKVIYFRNEGKWKDLCVADAVRMSIGIPFLFKPVIFEETEEEIKSFTGNLNTARFMVDGGVVDNFPIHAFDDPDSEELNPNIVGFTLVPESKRKTEEILTLTDYIDNTLYILLKNATELQFKTKSEKEQVIELDTSYISIFDFTFDPLPIDIIENSKKRTLEYFKK